MNLTGISQAKLVVAIPMIVILVSALTILVSANPLQSVDGQTQKSLKIAAPLATSGNNVYVAWPNDNTGHWNVYFAKSVDGGKTFENTIILSAPNKGSVVDQNVEIAASGSNVYVSWWTNKTGTLMPVFRASNDTGESFGKTMMLNSTK
jgi:lipopolysaccharide export LptBFGC system permease protein LptF